MNRAQEILIPENGVLRIAFLYVGQGEATLLVIPNGSGFQYALVDTNEEKENGGIDIAHLLSDLLSDDDELVFINTHPHKDHLLGISKINEKTEIQEVWHSGHIPGAEHREAYDEMKSVIKSIGVENEYVLFGTRDYNKIRKSDKETEVIKKLGNIDYQILSPAEYVQEDIDGEDAKGRYNRIHERCAVLQIMYGERKVLLSGDSDKKAWRDHISDYYSEDLPSDVLSASHHGSRTFFKDGKDDQEPFKKHLEQIKPEYLIISAPKQSESKHEHPHDDAIELYKEQIEDDNILHLGKNRECVLVDIRDNGNYEVKIDKDLLNHYKLSNGEDGGKESKERKKEVFIGSRTSRIDKQPMGLE